MPVDTMLFHRNLEHLAGTHAVNITAFGKQILTPLLSCKPCNHSGLNGRKVSYIKELTFRWHKGSPDELRQGIRHIVIEHGERFIITGSDESTSLI